MNYGRHVWHLRDRSSPPFLATLSVSLCHCPHSVGALAWCLYWLMGLFSRDLLHLSFFEGVSRSFPNRIQFHLNRWQFTIHTLILACSWHDRLVRYTRKNQPISSGRVGIVLGCRNYCEGWRRESWLLNNQEDRTDYVFRFGVCRGRLWLMEIHSRCLVAKKKYLDSIASERNEIKFKT